MQLDTQSIVDAIKLFLQDELNREVAKELNKEKNLSEQKRQEKHDKLYKKIQSDYEYDVWMTKFFASVEAMQTEQLSFATHTAKGIHTALKTENVIFEPKFQLPMGLVGTQSAGDLMIDANSNNPGGHAGYLKYIVAFVNIAISSSRIYVLIQNKDVSMRTFFQNHDADESLSYLESLLNKRASGRQTDGKNKQVLFYDGYNYVCLIPLYPASLAHQVYQHVADIKYSQYSARARSNRKEGKEPMPYQDMPDLAVVTLGGTNSNNVSRLNNIQGGRNYLLPSLPPKISTDRGFGLSKFCDNFFDSKSLAYQVKEDLEFIMQVVEDSRNTVDVRNRRKDAIDRILHTIFRIAHQLQAQPAGWSQDYALPIHQKIWLDPYRCDLGGEDALFEYKVNHHWQDEVMDEFAAWLNGRLCERFKKLKYAFADAEHTEWVREIEERQKFYARSGKGVFV